MSWKTAPTGDDGSRAAGEPLSPPCRVASSSGIRPKSLVSMSRAISNAPPRPKMWCVVPHAGQTKEAMFSMTPAIRCFVIWAIFAALAAVRAAASWGVVTMTISAAGIICATVRAMSPVPGGRSMSRKSGLPQSTSPRNCSMARPSMGPRQMTGSSPSRKKPMETTLTPCASGGMSLPSWAAGRTFGRPSMSGMVGP